MAGMSGVLEAVAALRSERSFGRVARELLFGFGRGARGGLTLILVLVAWQIYAKSGVVSSFLLPPLSVVLDRVWQDTLSGDLVLNLGATLYRGLFGFAIAASGGVALGLLIACNRAMRWFFDPIVSVGFPMPKIAFLPIFMLWFGLYDTSKITMIVVSAIFPVITATVVATQGVDKELLWSAQSLGVGKRRLLWEVILPAASPQIITGLQVALPVSLIVAIVCGMLMGGIGLGAAMINASRFADSPGVFAGILEIAVAGFLLVRGIALLRRWLLRWHQEAQDPTTV
jgi:ABC-type nitrate/sulfonate/bicarbonate transport system permease component